MTMSKKYTFITLSVLFIAFITIAIRLTVTGHSHALSELLASPEGNKLGVSYENAFPELSFKRPLDIQQTPGDPNHIYIVEQRGIIYRLEHNRSAHEKAIFMDIRDQVDDNTNEEGLLGLAFHPQFEQNGYFFVNYTTENPNLTRISRFQTDPNNPSIADLNSELVILTYSQPYWNHNGGGITFGPDGYLYIGVGDGGSGGDPQGNGQNLRNLLGTILRIDVNSSEPEKPYAIPNDNPFTKNNQGFREEIFAYGLRNPWRLHFDSRTGLLWTGDVGQNKYEEIDIIKKGGNYGWNNMEAMHCFRSKNCDTDQFEAPIWEYSHSQGSSITGGIVYRGNSIPELLGKYIYADFVSNRVCALDPGEAGAPNNTQLFKSRNLKVSSFGVDLNNELYICSFDGHIYTLTSN